jgi:hypothetical protein
MLERRAAAVAVKLASPPPAPSTSQSKFPSLFSRVYSTPTVNDPHVDRIRTDRVFYGWLERRFADYMCDVVGLQVRDLSLHAILFLKAVFSLLTHVQSPGGADGIWSASDVRVLGDVQAQEAACD